MSNRFRVGGIYDAGKFYVGRVEVVRRTDSSIWWVWNYVGESKFNSVGVCRVSVDANGVEQISKMCNRVRMTATADNEVEECTI
jgi:hypothetical protein